MKTLDALLIEVDKDTLAKLALATAAGVVAVTGGKKIYKKYKERQLLKKYGLQEDEKHQTSSDEIRGIIPDLEDAYMASRFIDAKK